jgi:hypothetical protein
MTRKHPVLYKEELRTRVFGGASKNGEEALENCQISNLISSL